MGCDIHCYVEYQEPGSGHWFGFGGEINPGRDYVVFGHLAGVRYGEVEHVEPRGVPEEISLETKWANQLYVDDAHASSEGYCTREQAESWTNHGYSQYLDEAKTKVTQPDWHTHSWLTTDEFEEALAQATEAARTHGRGIDTGYKALLAAMKVFSAAGRATRVVFWFDN